MHEWWSKIRAGERNAVGTTLTLDSKEYRIIGVLPPGVKFLEEPVDLYVSAGPREGKAISRADHGSMVLLGLLRRGVTPSIARADLNGIMQLLAFADGGPEGDHRSTVKWLSGLGTEGIRPTLILLMSAVALVLIIACANVASLLLARSTTRVREIAVRSAIGAGRRRLARQLLTENLIIAGLGGSAGLLLAGVCLRFLVRMGPPDLPRLWEANLNLQVLLFTGAITVLTGLLAGFVPVFQVGNINLMRALKEGSPSTGGGRRSYSLRGALVIAEIAVTLILAFGCGLLVRSLVLAQTQIQDSILMVFWRSNFSYLNHDTKAAMLCVNFMTVLRNALFASPVSLRSGP